VGKELAERGSEEGSYSKIIDFVYRSTLGVRVIKKRREGAPRPPSHSPGGVDGS